MPPKPKRWDYVSVEWYFDDDPSQIKRRTALCLTDPVGPEPYVILAFLTGTPTGSKEEAYELALSPGQADGGLMKPCVVRFRRLTSYNISRIIGIYGALPTHRREQARAILRRLFAL